MSIFQFVSGVKSPMKGTVQYAKAWLFTFVARALYRTAVKMKENGQFKISSNPFFAALSVIAFLFAVSGIKEIAELLKLAGEDPLNDVLGIGFMCLWTLFAAGMGLTALKTGLSAFVIDSEGVHQKNPFSKKELTWYEISDYGISYEGIGQNGDLVYCLYFSPTTLPRKGKYKKKTDKNTLKVTVSEDRLPEITEEVLPFCQSKIKPEPFITKKV